MLSRKKIIFSFDFLFFRKTKIPKESTNTALIKGKNDKVEIDIILSYILNFCRHYVNKKGIS